MATTVYGNTNPADSTGEQVFITYATASADKTYSVTLSAGIKATTSAISISSGGMASSVSVHVKSHVDGGSSSTHEASYDSGQANYSLAKGSSRTHISSRTWSINKTRVAQTFEIAAWSNVTWMNWVNCAPWENNYGIAYNATTSNSSLKTLSFTVPAMAQYTISFDLNGASGTAPSSQTQWADESITLPSAPTRTGYDFKGWGTTASGGVIYAAGSTYTATATITLHAIWQSNYVAPTISNFTAYRSTSSGTESDDDVYARVKFNYTEPELDYAVYSSYTIKVGCKKQSASSYTYQTVTGTNGIVDVILSGIEAEFPYDIRAVISTTGYSDVAKASYVSEAYYVMDVNSDGTAVAFFTAAQDGETGLYVNDNIYIALDENATGSATVDGEIMDALTELGWDSDVVTA